MTKAPRGFWAKPENVETLKKLHKQNLTVFEIASEMGISKNTITGKIYSLGLRNDRSCGPKHLRIATTAVQHPNNTRVYHTPSLPYIPPSKVFPEWWG